jgi:hypothetical protein
MAKPKKGYSSAVANRVFLYTQVLPRIWDSKRGGIELTYSHG